jgi:hypothetical protein
MSRRAAIVCNIGRSTGHNPIQTIARRIAKMRNRPALIGADPEITIELRYRPGRAEMNNGALLGGAGADAKIEVKQVIDYTWKSARAAARPPLSATFSVSIRKRRQVMLPAPD